MPKDKATGKKLADMMYGDPNRPAFGVYPMIAKRREDRQDREAAKNFPIDLGRGVFAGGAGLAGDMESLGRLPYVLYTGNESPTFLPTSEEILKRLPYGSDSPVGQFASGLGTLAGGSVPFGVIPKVVKAGAKGAMAAGRAGERMAEKYVPQIMERGGVGADILSGMAEGSRANVIKTPQKAMPIANAPSIIIPSKVGRVKEEVRQSKGEYGARRVERAADEIKNLERLYKEQALREAFLGDNAKAVMTMNPADFKKYAKELQERSRSDIPSRYAELAKQGEIDKSTMPTDEYIKHLQRVQGGFDDMPYLLINKEEQGLPLMPFISGHEGRHRSRAMAESGEPSSLVQLSPRSELREPFPRRSQEEYLEALRKELEMTDNMVLPEGFERPPIKLPDVYAKGGSVQFSDHPDTMALELAGGGKVGFISEGIKAAAKALKPAKEAAAPMKASEALGRIEGRPLVITQADRTKVGGGYLGGPGFSGLQLTEPEYRAAEAAWGVKTPGVAKMILGGSKGAGKDPVYAAMLGTPTQHQSNQMVFDKLYGDFRKAAKKGDLDSDLRDRINMRLVNTVDKEGNPIFPPDVDILGKNFKDLANTFDRRAVTANLIGGMGVGGKKGQIIDYDKIIRDTTDPLLIDSPTGALGNRLFTLSGGVIDRPDLHPAFPTIMQGEDLGVSFSPVARDLIMKDFTEKTMREKGRAPGYMDYTRGYPPSQIITEDILTEMQKLGLKEGGAVKSPAAKIDGNDFVLAAKKYGLDDSMRTLNKIVGLVNQGATVDEAARIVSNSTVRISDNSDTMALELAGGGKVGAITSAIKGLFSAVDKTAQNLKRPAGTGKEFMAEVKATPGVKATELKGRKLAEIEAMPKMTKAQFIKELEARPPVKIEEKVLGQPSQKDIDALADKLAYEKGRNEAYEFSNRGDDIEAMTEENYRLSLKHDWDDLQEQAREALQEGKDSAYHQQYTIPGGENYREILLKMPAAEGGGFPGVPQHFGGEPNILASIRVSDRMVPTYTPEQAESIGQRIAQGINVADPKNLASGAPEMAVKRGIVTPLEAAQYSDYRGYKNNDLAGAREKVLHVEEIQSDWHQAGRKARTDEIKRLVDAGMSKQEAQAAVPEDFGYSSNMAARRQELGDRYKRGELSLDQYDYLDRELTSVPDAPFKKDWQELALRKVMELASEGGYDRVALTKGAEQASRYDLSQQIDNVVVSPYRAERGEYTLQAIGKDGQTVIDKNDVQLSELDDYIGKELADKARQQLVDYGKSNLANVDLQVGGEKMQGFYDKMLPDYLNKMGKQYGVQVGEINIPTPQNKIPTSGEDMARAMGMSWEDFSRNRDVLEKEFWKMKQANTTPVHGFPITPQMREDINTKGQPLYSKIGVPSAEAAGAATIGSQIFDENNEQQVQNPIQFTENPDAMRLELMQRN